MAQLAEVPIHLIRIANAQDSKKLVWARMVRGRKYHAKLSNDEDRALCGAEPQGTRGYARWERNDNSRPTARRSCTDCALLFDGALKAVAEAKEGAS